MKPPLRRRALFARLALASVFSATLLAGCEASDVPVTQPGSRCSTDGDCDPGDDCVGGYCVGESAGPDGGLDGGASLGDAGSADAGIGGQDGGTDAGAGEQDGGTDAGTGEHDGGSDAGTSEHDGGSDAGTGERDGGSDAGTGEQDGGTDAGIGEQDGGTDAGTGGHDGGVSDAGPIGPTGGTVDLLDFTFTGDTRPPTCSQTATYPTATIAQEMTSMASLKPQFGLDLGDHMYVCSQDAAAAQAQMGLYVESLSGFKAPFFMTMGNHECENGADCSSTPTDANYSAYIAALKQISHEALPYYALQIQTRLGRASLVFVADDYFDATAQQWLQDTLADADAHSVYTFIIQHFPVTGSRTGPAGPLAVIEDHPYSMILTAHDHDYAHATTLFGGRSVICGLGGANVSHTGFCRVQQNADGTLTFTEYDLSANPLTHWSVTAR